MMSTLSGCMRGMPMHLPSQHLLPTSKTNKALLYTRTGIELQREGLGCQRPGSKWDDDSCHAKVPDDVLRRFDLLPWTWNVEVWSSVMLAGNVLLLFAHEPTSGELRPGVVFSASAHPLHTTRHICQNEQRGNAGVSDGRLGYRSYGLSQVRHGLMDKHEEIVLLDYLTRASPLNHLALVFRVMIRTEDSAGSTGGGSCH